MDIRITQDNKVQMHRQLWDDAGIVLAKCYNFDINTDNGVITCDPRYTNQKALDKFIEINFKNFHQSPLEDDRRNMFNQTIGGIYNDLRNYAESIIEPVLPYYNKFVTGTDGKQYSLYLHQKETLIEAFYKRVNFLALDMRLGKTVIAASISRVHQVPRTLIVCPSTAKWNAWFRDLTTKFGFNPLYFTVLDASRSRTMRAFNERFIIVNYDILDKYMNYFLALDIGHFIFDEAHKIKNTESNRFKNIEKIIRHFTLPRITFLSGTPISNRVNDLFSYLKLSEHQLGNNKKKFLEDFTLKSTGRGGERVTGSKNLGDLKIKLMNFMIRKRKEDCLDIPNQTYMQYTFELDDYREEYDKIIHELSQQKEISTLTGNLHSLNIITSKAKLKGIIEMAEDIIENKGKVVIFSNYSDPIAELEKHFGDRCVVITGSVQSHKRDGIVEKFRTDPNVPVFIGNMEAASEAINLAVADEIIIVDFPMVPRPLRQACERCMEIGKKNTINVNYTFCNGSVDEHLYHLVAEKEMDINAVINDGEEVMMREDIKEVLIKKLLNRDDIVFAKPFQKLEKVQEIQTGIGEQNQGIQQTQLHSGNGSDIGQSEDIDNTIRTRTSDVHKHDEESGKQGGVMRLSDMPELSGVITKKQTEDAFDHIRKTREAIDKEENKLGLLIPPTFD
jgi:SNF2 family DNA or RNA helicase